MHRWSQIQLMTNKFCGYNAQVVNRDPSGTTDADKLKHHKKWELEVEKKKGKTKVSPNGSNPCIPATHIRDDKATKNNGDSLDRPIGWKKEKEIRKRKGKDTESGSKFVEILQGVLMEVLLLEIKYCRGEGGGTKGGATKTNTTTEQQRLVLIGWAVNISRCCRGRGFEQNEYQKHRDGLTTKCIHYGYYMSWTKPPPGYHAINTDGSLSEVGGFGAIVRSEEGMSVKAVAS
ncbi:hypothetical protein GIB67_033957 [Kingdonia uniflora]|uniref:Uncharacterized protein n=1 Tax=Kingdonia uniflora TaxID=39325 RepID=A0A7J7NKJ5_9MAGN|nr:hypothetical protein GIB67_033957 [Kingdonia uniflora]